MYSLSPSLYPSLFFSLNLSYPLSLTASAVQKTKECGVELWMRSCCDDPSAGKYFRTRWREQRTAPNNGSGCGAGLCKKLHKKQGFMSAPNTNTTPPSPSPRPVPPDPTPPPPSPPHFGQPATALHRLMFIRPLENADGCRAPPRFLLCSPRVPPMFSPGFPLGSHQQNGKFELRRVNVPLVVEGGARAKKKTSEEGQVLK